MESLMGPELLLAALLVAVLAGASLLSLAREAPEDEAGQGLLQELGLSRTPTQSWQGRIGQAQVSYRLATPHRPGGFGVEVPLGSLSLSPRAGHTHLPLESEVRLGDPALDARFRIRGAAADLARLTAEVRDALVQAARNHEVWLQDDRIWVDCGRPDRQALEKALALAALLAQAPADPDARLRAWVLLDPLPEVRERALASLVTDHHELGERLAPLASRDSSPQVRAQAALLLDDPQLLFEIAIDPELEPWQREHAVDRLDAWGTDADRLRLGERLVEEAVPGMERRAVALLAAAGEAGEPALLRLLDHSDLELVREVLRALGEVGTIRAVPILRERQSRLSVMQSRLSGAFESAIAAIQVSAGGEPGGLAIAPVQGALSVSPPRGAVSVRLPSRERG